MAFDEENIIIDADLKCLGREELIRYVAHILCRAGSYNISLQDNDILLRFMRLLEEGVYVKHREVGYYAEQLFVTPKYLSEVCKRVSGKNALYWINRFTTIHLRRLLQAKQLTLTEIADMFDFSSVAYFSRFVQKNLGALPSEFAN